MDDLPSNRRTGPADLTAKELSSYYAAYSAEAAFRLDPEIAGDWYSELPSLQTRSLHDRTDGHIEHTQFALEGELHRRYKNHPAHQKFMRWVSEDRGPDDKTNTELVHRLIAMLRAIIPGVLAN